MEILAIVVATLCLTAVLTWVLVSIVLDALIRRREDQICRLRVELTSLSQDVEHWDSLEAELTRNESDRRALIDELRTAASGEAPDSKRIESRETGP